MSGNTTKPFVGYVKMKKTGGTASPAIGTELTLPITASKPRDPRNTSYPTGVNKSAFPSLAVLGKRTPTLEIRTLLQASWLSPAFLTSLIAAFDGNGDGDQWGILLNDGTQGAP